MEDILTKEHPMETAKEEVMRILESLPEDASAGTHPYRIYVRQAIASGA